MLRKQSIVRKLFDLNYLLYRIADSVMNKSVSMAVKIRLARFGKKKHPFYRVVVANSLAPRDGRFIERIGQYNPMMLKNNKDRVVVKVDRLKYWLNVGAQPTKRVLWFIESGMITLETKKKKIEAEKTEKEKVAAQEAREQEA